MFKKNTLPKLIIFVVALQILNMSIDVSGTQIFKSEPQTSNYNYIDTYIEYIAEIVLKYENAIPESRNRQHKELQQHKQFQVICEIKEIPYQDFFRVAPIIVVSDHPDNYSYKFIKEINHPPGSLLS